MAVMAADETVVRITSRDFQLVRLIEMAIGLKGALNKVKNLFSLGLFHILGADVINKVVTFLANIVIVRILSQDEYGLFSYANNIYGMILLLSGFGVLTGMMQLGSEKRPERERCEILRYSLTRGLVINCALALGTMVIGMVFTLPIEESGRYLVLFAPLLILDFIFQYDCTFFRVKRKNKQFAVLQVINTVSYSVFGCAGAFLFGVVGTIVGRYIAYGVSGLAALLMSKDLRHIIDCGKLSSAIIRKELWSFSIPAQASSCINQLNPLINVYLVGIFLASASDVALYSVATLIPNALLFIPRCLLVFALPFFIEHNHEKKWFRKKSREFVLGSSISYVAISMVLILVGPFLIPFLWGSDYVGAVGPFCILAAGLVFSAIRTTCINLLGALRAVKSNLIISILSLIINVVLCPVLIVGMGMMGAALALLVISVVGSVLSLILLLRGISAMK